MTANSLSIRVEEACIRAWPALDEEMLNGWLLRFAGGVSRRANSVNVLAGESRDLEDKIAICEARYRAHGLPPLFRLPDFAAPGLDAALERLGYGLEGETLVRYKALPIPPPPDETGVELLARPSAKWLSARRRFMGWDENQAGIYADIVARLALPAVFAAMRREGELVSCAYGAIHEGLVCLESVATASAARRTGAARQTVNAILAWAHGQGAGGACLQVEAANAPANALYTDIGFGEALYRYHYRRAPG